MMAKKKSVLENNFGLPVRDNQNSLTAGMSQEERARATAGYIRLIDDLNNNLNPCKP
jgi:hypothetical protein